MHNMPDYGFYKDVYLGTSVSEVAFPELIARAKEWLEKIERCCRVVPYGPDSRKMALCSIAETLLVWYKKQNFTQATVGGVTVRYEKNDLPLQRQLVQNIAGYLEIYRGVPV